MLIGCIVVVYCIMTNSIATSKCPSTVLTSGNYGMSQNRCTDETKEYIFVKLTDSALRAIEEYQRNDNAKRFKGTEQSAKIQFSDGNNGFIHFPLPDSQEGRKFGFAIDDIEGSLECIHQQQQELNVLGALSYRMRIHANDDVYDTTRTKMAIAEETEKSKCIREIKPNQTDIGRKIKKPITSAAAMAATIIANSNSHRENNHNNNNNNNYLISSNNNNNNRKTTTTTTTLSAISTLSSQLASGITNGYAEMKTSTNNTPMTTTTPTPTPTHKTVGNKNSTKIVATQKGGNVGGTGGGNNKLPDISRRKIRERLIHLLALKPFKKPELYTRLQNEGLRDRERPLISNILKDISALSRDNTFNLKRQMWNDVNENWPYYTEQEIQQLKRRKPQNLTPPLSSDAGSSTSGHSPTSIHTGSPPPLVLGGAKRSASDATGGGVGGTGGTGFDDNFFSGVQSKKQRISHFKKDPGPGVTAAANQRFNNNNNTNNANRHNSTTTTTTSTDYLGRHKNHHNNNNNSDLSFNVLENVDELMPHMQEQTINNNNNNNFLQQQQQQQQRKNSNNINNNKDKQQQQQLSSSTSKQQQQRHNYANSAAISPKPYGSSFVPESGKKSNNNNNNNNKNSPQTTTTIKKQTTTTTIIIKQQQQIEQQQQYVSPNKQDDHHNNNNNNNNHRSQSPNNINNYKIPKNRYQQQPTLQQNVKKRQMNDNQQESTTTTTATTMMSTYQPQQQQTPPQQQLAQQQNKTNYYSSPTQQIAAAASNYATTALNDTTNSRQKYDFSQYTAITSIEQRRKYKTEFEADYDEYLKLLAQIESVGKRFRALADQLENARKGCADYFEIKQQIVMEYERIRNEESLKRDKQRFDYLHEKLAHIKQLVTDYDKTLTDAAEHLRQQQQQLEQLQQQQLEQQEKLKQQQKELQLQQQQFQQQQQLQQQQQQQQQRLSPMIISEGESNPSPPMNYQQQQQPQQTQPQQQKYHAAETILSRSTSNFNATYMMLKQQYKQQQKEKQQRLQQQQQQKQQQKGIIKNETNENSDSDSSTTSDDYDDDDDDDDEQTHDDDENSNSNDTD